MSEVQAVIFDINKYNTKEARKWLKDNNYNPKKRVHKTENYLRYRIEEPEQYKRLRTKDLKNGVKLILGFK